MLQIFDKQLTLRMGQANVRRWVDDILPLLLDGDPLGVDDFATHHVPLDGGAAGLRDLPEEGGRRLQGRLHAVSAMSARQGPSCQKAAAGRKGGKAAANKS